MNRKDWQRAYDPISAHLDARVQNTLAQLDAQSPGRRIPLRTAAVIVALVLALGGVAYAVFHSQVASLFGWLYGRTREQEMLSGDIDAASKSYQLGDVVYTLEEMVYKSEGDNEGLYGVVRISPAEGSNIVLIPQDYGIDEPAGYLVHYGTDEEIPEDAPSYAELAKQQGGKIIMARLTVKEVYQNGKLCEADIGEHWLAQRDGSLLGGLEIIDGTFEWSDRYELNLSVSNWEITPDGDWLREEPDNTWMKTNWMVTIAPTTKGE